MFNRLLEYPKRLFTKPGKKSEKVKLSSEQAELLTIIADSLIADVEMNEKAQNIEAPYGLLTPIVPLPASESHGWFGGAPRLPEEMAWPKMDDQELRFVCQLDLSALPQNVWSGLGPRDGWIAVFVEPFGANGRVFHFDGPLSKREGPGQSGAAWFRRRFRQDEPVADHSPEWPIMLTGQMGKPPVTMQRRKGFAPGVPDPRKTEVFSLSDPAFLPFNEKLLDVVIQAVAEHFDRTKSQIEVLLANNVREEDRSKLDHYISVTSSSMEMFQEAKERLYSSSEGFSFPDVTRIMKELDSLKTHSINYVNEDRYGNADLEFSDLTLCEKPTHYSMVQWWPEKYLPYLYRHAIHAYTSAPESLPLEVRARMETLWSFDALHESGYIGHSPGGFISTPRGPGTENEVLLQLPTSDLVGWIWGDMYSLILTINREALARGDFGEVKFHISN